MLGSSAYLTLGSECTCCARVTAAEKRLTCKGGFWMVGGGRLLLLSHLLLLLNPIASPSSPHGCLSPPFGGSRPFWRCPPPSCWPPSGHPAGCFWHPQQWHFKPPPPASKLDFPPSPPAALSAHFFDIFQSTAGSSYDMAQVHIVFG